MSLYAVLVLMLAGALMIAKPDWFWQIDRVITMRSGEPRPMYLTLMRLLGAVLLVGPVAVLLAAALG